MYLNTRQRIPNIIDIEASGFGPNSYPIEVGVVLADNRRYSRLIKPYPDWTHWCEQAESVHGISRESLQKYGIEGRQIALDLNKMLRGCILYSDCWGVDKPWLETLFYRSGVSLEFFISPLESILKEEQMLCWQVAMSKTRESLQLARHRASTDALAIQQTFLATSKH